MKPVGISTLTQEVREIHESYPTWTLDNAFVHWFVQAFDLSPCSLSTCDESPLD